MTKHQPWEPGCIVLTPRDFDCRNAWQFYMAALAEMRSADAIEKAMRLTACEALTKPMAAKKWKKP